MDKQSRKQAVNLLYDAANREGYQFVVHNQGKDESCVAHAFTAAHEIYRRKRFWTHDLLANSSWMTDIGALMMDIAKRMEITGQKESNSDTVASNGERAKRHCRSACRLRFEQLPISINKLKTTLAQGFPLVMTVSHFPLKDRCASLANASNPNITMEEGVLHAICVYGFEEDTDNERDASGGGRFLCVNSHGIEWGNAGHGCLTFAYVSKFAFQIWTVAKGQSQTK